MTEAGVLGAAILAGVGVKAFRDIPEGCEAMVQVDTEYIPDKDNAALYGELYGVFCRLYDGLADSGVFNDLSGIQHR